MKSLKVRTIVELLGKNFQRALIVASPAAIKRLGMDDVAVKEVGNITFKEGKNITIQENNTDSILRVHDVTGYPKVYDQFDTIVWVYVVGDQLIGERIVAAKGLATKEQYFVTTMDDWREVNIVPERQSHELLSHIYDGLERKERIIVMISEPAAERLGIKDMVNLYWPETPTGKITFVDKWRTRIPRRAIFEANCVFEVTTRCSEIVCISQRVNHADEKDMYLCGREVKISSVDLGRLPALVGKVAEEGMALKTVKSSVPAFKVSLNTILDAVNSSLIVVDTGAYEYLKSQYGFSERDGKVLGLCFEDKSPDGTHGQARFVDVLLSDKPLVGDAVALLNYSQFEELQKYRQIFYIESAFGVLRTRHIRFKPGMFPPAFELITESNQLEVDFPKK